MSARDSVLTGSAGERYILYRLHRQGILAAQSPEGARDADILVFGDGTEGIRIQVKTRTTGADGGWHMRSKHERMADRTLLYAFVDMQAESPIVYLVPSKVVARVLAASHRAWLAGVGKKGQQRRDTDLRRLLPAYGFNVPGVPPGWLEQYRERWDLTDRAATHEDATTAPMDARSLLESLVGTDIQTLEGKWNRVLAVLDTHVIVATERSPMGSPVKIEWVQHALDLLSRDRFVEVNVATLKYRSAFCGAVLATITGTVTSLRPAVVRYA